MLHLFRRKSPGVFALEMARTLERSILQPRLVSQAQFRCLTLCDWDCLETVNREAMLAITGLPRMTPIPAL